MVKANKEKQRKAPILRFKGFTDDWEQRKLKVLGNIKRGASPRPISDPKWFDTNGKYGWLRISDVTSQNGQVFQINQHLSSIGEEKTVLISDPHLIISIAATVGKPCINYIPTAIHDGFVTFLDYKFNLDFMFEWFNKNQNIWLKYGQPGAQINLNSSIIGNQKIEIPKENEQEKIAKLFNILNNLLALYERKVKLLTQIEKYLLDNLFAEKDYPNLRFKGFTDAWEQRYLLKITKKEDNKRIPIKEQDRKKGNTPYYGANGIQDHVKGYTHCGTNILIAEDGASNIQNYPTILTNGKIWVNNHAHVLNVNSETINGNFIVGAVNKIKFYKYLVGSGRYKLTAESLNQIKIQITGISEQNKIGKLFEFIDNLLTLYEDKQQHLTEIKKTFLNTMFI